MRSSKNTSKVVQITSVHNRYDTRIFHKISSSLANNGYDLHIIVADGLGSSNENNIKFIDVGLPQNRIFRIFITSFRILGKATSLKASIYHFHDPELLFVGIFLRLLGKKVVYDIHEDTKNQILLKPYLHPVTSYFISKLFAIVEATSIKLFSGIVTATDKIYTNHSSHNKISVCVKNYPIIEKLDDFDSETSSSDIVYVGGLSPERGTYELLESLSFLHDDIKLNICGKFFDSDFESKIKSHPNWKRVNFHGFVSKDKVLDIISSSFLGVVNLHPTPTYSVSLPVKLFEYMNLGLPVVCSNFPLWKNLFSDLNFSIFINPSEPEDIARAVNMLYKDINLRKKHSRNSRKAIVDLFNWDVEQDKLLNFYQSILVCR